MDVYLIRHGESEANADRTHSGWSPVNLTEKGRAQAALARRHIEHLAFDRVYVSDVRRAQQTANILFPGQARIFLPRAREINNTTMRGKSAEDMMALFPDRYPACRENFDYAPLGLDCESQPHMRLRAQALLDELTRLSDLERVAIVAHAGFLGSVVACVLQIPHARALLCDNASISVLRYDERGWRVKLWNLPPELT